MSGDPSRFQAFIADWRARRLANLSISEMTRHADTLGAELSAAALQAGLSPNLTVACRPYRSIAAYVRRLHDVEMQRR